MHSLRVSISLLLIFIGIIPALTQDFYYAGDMKISIEVDESRNVIISKNLPCDSNIRMRSKKLSTLIRNSDYVVSVYESIPSVDYEKFNQDSSSEEYSLCNIYYEEG